MVVPMWLRKKKKRLYKKKKNGRKKKKKKNKSVEPRPFVWCPVGSRFRRLRGAGFEPNWTGEGCAAC